MSGRSHARMEGGGATPRLQVQRSLSRDTITIHFSALSRDDGEDKEELYSLATPSYSSSHQPKHDDQNTVMAEKSSRKPSLQRSGSVATVMTPRSVPGLPISAMTTSSPTLTCVSSSLLSSSSDSAAPSLPWPVAPKSPPTDHTAPLSAPPLSKPVSLPSKPFLSLVRSLSTEAEGSPPPRFHRQLVKTLVKSLSMDTSQTDIDPVPQNQPDGDSKTAPSSPLAVPPLLEMEGYLEDSRQRLSEVISEPLQLLNRMRTDEASAGTIPYRPRNQSSSLQDVSLNTRSENGYVRDEKQDATDSQGTLALVLDRCSMSALARQQLQELQQLYSQDAETDAEEELNLLESTTQVKNHKAHFKGDKEEQDKEEVRVIPSSIPHKFLFTLAVLVYGCLILPLPSYLGGVLLGVAAGFILAAFMLWLAACSHPHCCVRKSKTWNVASLDIQEPGIFKGWMNEIHNYDPEMYHATLTHSVFVRLEGSTLRLSRPNRNITRRATFNEPKPDVTYISQKIYDLTDSKIYLMPQNLARKRVWNKKYPICVELARQESFLSKAQGNSSEMGTGDREGTSATGDHTLYLFGRTGREKEEWFRRMSVASQMKLEAKKVPSIPMCKSTFVPTHSRSNSQAGAPTHSRSSSQSSMDDPLGCQTQQREPTAGQRQKALLDYNVYMAQYIPSPPSSPSPGSVQSGDVSPGDRKLSESPKADVEPEAWVNALLGRIFWDFLREKYWADMVSRKAQMKLSKIRLPYFMNELTLTELDMGISIPKIIKASPPTVDHQGLWIDLDISYSGSFLMTLETKMNLARLGKDAEGLRFGEMGKDGSRPRTYCLADSDEESSSAGSSDEEDPTEIHPEKNLTPGAEGYVGGHRPSKIMRFVDKIAKSKYFQKATETEFIKKKMEEVSNTPLLLTVEVQELHGTLSVNIPPPPTDRIWYGFRTPPHLVLKARPKLGEREVTLAHVTDWIEKKLVQEFQKIFLMPNMDDIWLPIMHSAMDTRSTVSLVTRTAEDLKELDVKEMDTLTSVMG